MVRIKIHTTYEGGWSDATEPLLCLETGCWRSERPVLDTDRCSHCGLCALYCPTQCMVDKEEYFLPSLDYCKGCGICSRECPQDAIAMLPEESFFDDSDE
jgi:pyruvate ferredoxin oxidoreductase delta subunit